MKCALFVILAIAVAHQSSATACPEIEKGLASLPEKSPAKAAIIVAACIANLATVMDAFTNDVACLLKCYLDNAGAITANGADTNILTAMFGGNSKSCAEEHLLSSSTDCEAVGKFSRCMSVQYFDMEEIFKVFGQKNANMFGANGITQKCKQENLVCHEKCVYDQLDITRSIDEIFENSSLKEAAQKCKAKHITGEPTCYSIGSFHQCVEKSTTTPFFQAFFNYHQTTLEDILSIIAPQNIWN